MALIELCTVIDAPRERVFDLARSIDAHQVSTSHTRERAVAGITSGLIELGETVTWEARHLGVKQRLTVQVTAMERPFRFRDQQVRGAFGKMVHDHVFEERDGRTVMIDRFEFVSPFGFVGRIVDRLFLAAYMRRFLATRANQLKAMAESERWKQFVQEEAARSGE